MKRRVVGYGTLLLVAILASVTPMVRAQISYEGITETFTVPGCVNGTCQSQAFKLVMLQGAALTGTISADHKIMIFIMSNKDHQKMMNGVVPSNPCCGGTQSPVTSQTLDWFAPYTSTVDAPFWLTIVNMSDSTATVSISIHIGWAQ